ncbi:right-handed parallel beta-helix repeat-containing protein [Halorientalis brevis]|uniref:Right-handed parallel beta-helix repeat-containing protein n=1 Tax=Halorientalis brevis TaxID=1126241 RepID=A0ABD6C5S0_9EURY
MTVAVAALVAGVVVGSTAGATAATTQTVTECTTITEPGAYELSANVSAPANDTCIRIESSDVVLDGQGQTITGTNGENATGTGILVSASEGGDLLENVTVRNVHVANWGTGVTYRDVTDSTLSSVTVTDSQNGLTVTESSQITIQNTSATDNEDGVLTRDVTDSTFHDTTVANNEGTGLYTSNDFDGNRLVNTTARENGETGIRIGPAWNTEFVNTTTSSNGGDGLTMLDSGRVEMSHLTATDNGETALSLTAVAGARFENVTVQNNTGAVYAAVESRNVTVQALTMGPGGTVSLTAGSATITDAEPPAAPEGYEAVGPAINVSRAEDGPSMPVVSITLDERDETTPALWQYEDGEWRELSDVTFDSGEYTLTATVGNGIVTPLDTTTADNETDG